VSDQEAPKGRQGGGAGRGKRGDYRGEIGDRWGGGYEGLVEREK